MTSSSVAANASPIPSASVTQRWTTAFALCALACALAMRFVDRPVADFVHAHLRHTTFYVITNRVLGVTLLALPLAFLILVASGMLAMTGRPLPPWLRTLTLCSWSIMWALSAAIMFKVGIGRTSPDPEYVIARLYGFHFLNGGPGREAFPSATTAVAAAVLSILWMRAPGSRRPMTSLFALIVLALIATNNHWVSDTIGGSFLGVTVGASTYALLERRA